MGDTAGSRPPTLPAGAGDWLAEVLDSPVVEVDSERIRPWSGVWSFLDDAGARWWFKANARGTVYEPALLEVLAAIGSPLVPVVGGIDTSRAWSVTRDAGASTRTVFDAVGAGDPANLLACWEPVLAAYASLQLATASSAAALAAAGVPELGPDSIPALFADLVDDTGWLIPGRSEEMPMATYERLLAAAPAVADACERVAALGLPLTVQHDDLHEGNLYVRAGGEPVSTVMAALPAELAAGDVTIIDWGDAYLGVPLGTLLVTLRTVAERVGVGYRDPAPFDRLVDAYLEPFTGPGRRRTELRAALPDVMTLARIGRAASWRRALGDPAEAAALGWHDVPGWMATVVGSDWI